MQHLKEYIESLNQAIKAGVDVRFEHNGTSVPAVRTIVINEEEKCLDIWYREEGKCQDQQTSKLVSTKFTSEFNDLPNDLRAAGWR